MMNSLENAIVFIFSGSIYPKWKETYIKVNDQVEKWSEIVHLIVAKATPLGLVLTKFIVNLFVYFTTDHDSETVELELPFPMWYVQSFNFYSLLHLYLRKLLFVFKVSVRYKKSHRLFDCCFLAILTDCLKFLLCRKHTIFGNWILFVYEFNDRKQQGNSDIYKQNRSSQKKPVTDAEAAL